MVGMKMKIMVLELIAVKMQHLLLMRFHMPYLLLLRLQKV
ncbi:hypothetical protein N752_29670 [Desulforamulus aquiferis]|nr:hypothetical protein N752_29670 [Desulforamulus aquiferis]